MDEERFTLGWDPVKRLLKLKSSGFWSVDNLADYDREFEATLSKIIATKAPFDFLADLTEHPAQSPEVTERLTQYALQMQAAGLRKMAGIASSSTLARLQAQRSSADLNNRFFPSEAEALAWLEE